MTQSLKEYCGSCGAPWNTLSIGDPRNNSFCCPVPFFQSSEYCGLCMGTGGEYPHAVCPHCKGTGEKLDEE